MSSLFSIVKSTLTEIYTLFIIMVFTMKTNQAGMNVYFNEMHILEGKYLAT